jgi:hypothetical protein
LYYIRTNHNLSQLKKTIIDWESTLNPGDNQILQTAYARALWKVCEHIAIDDQKMSNPKVYNDVNQIEVVKLLLSKKCSTENCYYSKIKSTPLFLAVKTVKLEIVKLLLDVPCNVNALNVIHENAAFYTLYGLTEHQRVETEKIFQLLVAAKIDLQVENTHGHTLSTLAVSYGSIADPFLKVCLQNKVPIQTKTHNIFEHEITSNFLKSADGQRLLYHNYLVTDPTLMTQIPTDFFLPELRVEFGALSAAKDFDFFN